MKISVVLLIITSLFLITCKKSPDIEQNVVGTWELENYIANGTDSASVIDKTLDAKCIFNFYPYHTIDTYGDNKIQWGNDTSNNLLMEGFYEVMGNGNKSYSISHQDNPYTHYAKIYIAIADSTYSNFQVSDIESQTLWLSFTTRNRNYELHFNRIQ